ncbi:MAG: nucleoid-associated protein [Bacteroidota bacterium]
MIDFSSVSIDQVSVHQVGNKTNGDDLIISKTELDIEDLQLRNLLKKFFLTPFTSNEFYNFTFSNGDFKLNPIYNYASQLFDGASSFHLNTVNIAKQLFEVSNHPQIKAGDLFVAALSNVGLQGKTIQAIGIFKSENRQDFLKLNAAGSGFNLQYFDGINIEKLDKGCIIFDIEQDKGFKVCVVDKSNKSTEAQYWKDTFLLLTPCNDEYHQTKDFLNIAKNYVTTQLPEDFAVNKTDQIDILNRSMEYFKTHNNFEKDEFEQEVFQDPDLINSFRKFDETYRADHAIDMESSFEISSQAVKKQARVFKSILKLDKNFHIYIHGNKDLIEHGVENDGRKYYKIYYEKEV